MQLKGKTTDQKPGLYVHIPFCKQACSYCNFYFSTNQASVQSLTKAICQELSIKQNFWPQRQLNSIYFGGGTPSLMPQTCIKDIFKSIRKHFVYKNDIEITFECNPDDINAANLAFWRELGINRLSIGIQSFIERDLVLMNRSHNVLKAVESIELAKSFGFNNITIDIIYGVPGQCGKELTANLENIVKYKIPHFSAYALTVEPKTLLAHQIKGGKVKETTDETFQAHFEIIKDFANRHNFHHYEISNFAIAGKEAVHNSNYWRGKPYIGVGPSAHSFNGEARFWNVANNHQYIKAINLKEPFWEKEILSQVDKYNEYIITNIRTSWGLSSYVIEDQFSNHSQHFIEQARLLESKKLIENTNNIFTLTQEGQFLCDHVSTLLMADSE